MRIAEDSNWKPKFVYVNARTSGISMAQAISSCATRQCWWIDENINRGHDLLHSRQFVCQPVSEYWNCARDLSTITIFRGEEILSTREIFERSTSSSSDSLEGRGARPMTRLDIEWLMMPQVHRSPSQMDPFKEGVNQVTVGEFPPQLCFNNTIWQEDDDAS